MAGQTIVNFDGLSPEAAAALAAGLADAVRARIEGIANNVRNLEGEDATRFERMIGALSFADGNCGNGCA